MCCFIEAVAECYFWFFNATMLKHFALNLLKSKEKRNKNIPIFIFFLSFLQLYSEANVMVIVRTIDCCGTLDVIDVMLHINGRLPGPLIKLFPFVFFFVRSACAYG